MKILKPGDPCPCCGQPIPRGLPAEQMALFIDADSQGDGTALVMGGRTDCLEGAGLAEVLRYDLDYYPDVICTTDLDGVDIMPATESPGDFELECSLEREKADLNRLRALPVG